MADKDVAHEFSEWILAHLQARKAEGKEMMAGAGGTSDARRLVVNVQRVGHEEMLAIFPVIRDGRPALVVMTASGSPDKNSAELQEMERQLRS